MYARRLSVHNYRSFPSYELELDQNTTVLVGRNAAGKTNLIEGLQLLCTGRSFRKPRPQELLREGSETGRIELEMEGDGRLITTACSLEGGKRSFTRNGKKVSAAGVRGDLAAVLFCPDHLDMVKRSARVRREAIDDFGCQLSAPYEKLVSSYERVLTQRNNLLKEPDCPPEVLAVWTDSLVQMGVALVAHRRALLDRVGVHMVEAYGAISPHERLEVAYRSSLGEDAVGKDEVASLFEHALAERGEDERRRGTTLVGPHRDDISFIIDGRPAREFASQGQQRSVVLAWKLAEVRVSRDILGGNPLLLLDDVMSELDEGRRQAIMGFVEGDIQTVITTTNLGYFSPAVLKRTTVVGIDGA